MTTPRKHIKPALLRGTGASPGIAVGRSFLMDRDRIKVVRNRIGPERVEQEQERFTRAVLEAQEQINHLLDEIPEELKEHAGILNSHLLMLRDRMIHERTLQIIAEEMINAEWALNKALERVRSLFLQIKEQYIRDRIEDIDYVARRVQDILSGRPLIDLRGLEEPVILVAHDLSPADTVQIQPDKVLAFVTDAGSRASHTAILARALGIPAVVGLERATADILSGEKLIVDGLCGDVLRDPDEDLCRRYEERQQKYRRYRLELIHHSHLPAETRDGYSVSVKANMEFPEEVSSLISHGAEGVGLFRTEFLYLARQELPSEEDLLNTYQQVAERISPDPVTIRTLDIGGDKFSSSISLDEEINPALGLRAIRLCLREPGLFRTQLRAILRASAHGNVRILFPLVSGRLEIIQAKQHLEDVKDELRRENMPFDEDIRIGVMIEVPTAVVVADILAREVDFFSIGTNDLIQYSLAIDRGNEYVAHLYEPLHPGVLRMISRTVESAHEAGIEVAICGEMAGEAMYVPLLVGLELDELSMNASAIPKIKRMIRKSSLESCSDLVADLLDASTAQETTDLLREFLSVNFRNEFDPTLGLYAGCAGRYPAQR